MIILKKPKLDFLPKTQSEQLSTEELKDLKELEKLEKAMDLIDEDAQ